MIRYNKSELQKGFTLLELSIVIVIIGLIVAGVSAGQSLVTQANIRSTVAKMEQYDTAISTFKLTYNYMPGDMSAALANSYWSLNEGGDADGYIESCCGDPATGGAVQSGEELDVWAHLSRASLIDGDYTGVGVGYDDGHVVDQNIPSAVFSATNFGVEGSYLVNGAFNPTYNDATGEGAFTPQFVYNIDKKLDDGVATTGVFGGWPGVYGFGNTQRPCFSSGDYDLSVSTGNYCILLRKISIAKR